MATPALTEAWLRRWVRGELPRAEGRALARLVVRCTDPRLPALLRGMAEELRQEQEDARLVERGRAWTDIVEAWDRLLDAASAAWQPATGGLVLAGMPAPENRRLWFSQDPGLMVHATPPGHGEWLMVVATDDTGRANTLLEASTTPTAIALAAPTPLPPRWTVWAAWGPLAHRPRPVQPALDLLRGLLDNDKVEVRAARPYDDTARTDPS